MSRDTSFYYSFLVLPARKRSAIVAVWDFCRAVDDAVDQVVPEPVPEPASEAALRGLLSDAARARAAEQLCEWRRELKDVYEGTPRTPQGIGLQPFVREFGLPREQFESLAIAINALGRANIGDHGGDTHRCCGDQRCTPSDAPTHTAFPSAVTE